MSENFELPSETIEKHVKRVRRNSQVIYFFIFIVFVIVLAGVLLAVFYLPNFKQIPPDEYFGLSEMPTVVIGGERIGSGGAVYHDGETFFTYEFARTYFDKYIFFDESKSAVTITTPFGMCRIYEGRNEYIQNNETVWPLGRFAFIREDVMYLPSEFLCSVLPYKVDYVDSSRTVVVDIVGEPLTYGSINAKRANVRYAPDIKSPIQKKLTADTPIIVFEEADERFTKIRTADDGSIGYIYTADYFITSQTEGIDLLSVYENYPYLTLDEPVVMLWDQIYSKEGNAADSKRVFRDGVNVLSPTWFSFDETLLDGSIIDIGDMAYVDFAHENGVYVWALITDNFKSVIGDTLLTDPDIRDYIIEQLMNFTQIYALDGINIDFEMISQTAAPYFLQFLRELSVFTRRAGVVLSVDMFVPTFTMHYNRAEVIKAADYICLMAYDEHYGPASGSGPVASLPFVEDGIVKSLREIPNNRLILGLPFYTRTWREEQQPDGTVSVSRKQDLYMGVAEREFYNNGASAASWFADIGYYYNEYTINEDGANVVYKAWFEDETSIREKMLLYDKHSLAGIAGWSRGMETDDCWAVITEQIKKTAER